MRDNRKYIGLQFFYRKLCGKKHWLLWDKYTGESLTATLLAWWWRPYGLQTHWCICTGLHMIWIFICKLQNHESLFSHLFLYCMMLMEYQWKVSLSLNLESKFRPNMCIMKKSWGHTFRCCGSDSLTVLIGFWLIV